MMVWQAAERNEWDVAIHQSLEAEGPIALPSEGPDPFSLADPPAVTEILEAAGFADVTFTDVHEPVYYGPDVASALDWVRGFTCTSDALERLDPAAADARARAAARGARRARQRRRCLVRLPRLDRHRSSPLSANPTALNAPNLQSHDCSACHMTGRMSQCYLASRLVELSQAHVEPCWRPCCAPMLL